MAHLQSPDEVTVMLRRHNAGFAKMFAKSGDYRAVLIEGQPLFQEEGFSHIKHYIISPGCRKAEKPFPVKNLGGCEAFLSLDQKIGHL